MFFAFGGRGSWIPEGTAGKVVVLLIFGLVVGMFAWGLWTKTDRERRR